jgi:hypothetical protein
MFWNELSHLHWRASYLLVCAAFWYFWEAQIGRFPLKWAHLCSGARLHTVHPEVRFLSNLRATSFLHGLYLQIIDDTKSHTLATASTLTKDLKEVIKDIAGTEVS